MNVAKTPRFFSAIFDKTELGNVVTDREIANHQKDYLERAEPLIEAQYEAAAKLLEVKTGTRPEDNPVLFATIMDAFSANIGAQHIGVKVR